jgi:phosphate uptake regulator
MWKELMAIFKSDNLLQQAWNRSYEMLEIDQDMFLEAVMILRERDDANVSEEIRQKDKIVNKYEREVRRKVMTHCTVQGPTSIPAGMALVSIIIDIERIGDYTKNMVDLARNHPTRLLGGTYEEELQRVETAVKDNFVRTRSCIESSDADAALKLLKDYEWVNRACDNILMDLVSEKDKEIRSGEAVSLSLYYRWLKRINSHLRNITTSVVNPFDRIGYRPKNNSGHKANPSG